MLEHTRERIHDLLVDLRKEINAIVPPQPLHGDMGYCPVCGREAMYRRGRETGKVMLLPLRCGHPAVWQESENNSCADED